jgi:hypothetical protein
MTKIGPLLIAIATAVFIALLPIPSEAHGNEHGSVKATINGAHISIDYGRPALKGRDMLRQITPGEFWRIGADVPTSLESDRDLNFGGTIVSKGKHTLLAHFVSPGKWMLVFSGKSVSPRNPGAQRAEVPMTLQEASDSTELVTIQLTDKGGTGVIEIAWGRLRLSASFTPA